MALTPWNRQEEWYQQMINASTGNYLPSITSQDAGKVMTVESDGSWGVENIPSELPSVTPADETKVLTVDSNGDWVAADAPSASDIYLVNATFTEGRKEWSVTLDKTFAEISASANAGKIVLCIPHESANGDTGYPCVMTVESTEAFANADVDVDNGAVYSFNFGIDNNDDTYVTVTTWSKSGGGALVVHDDKGILDKTWQEIHDAMLVGGVVLSLGDTRAANISGVDYSDRSGSYVVSWCNAGEFQIGTYTASSADGYPTED